MSQDSLSATVDLVGIERGGDNLARIRFECQPTGTEILICSS